MNLHLLYKLRKLSKEWRTAAFSCISHRSGDNTLYCTRCLEGDPTWLNPSVGKTRTLSCCTISWGVTNKSCALALQRLHWKSDQSTARICSKARYKRERVAQQCSVANWERKAFTWQIWQQNRVCKALLKLMPGYKALRVNWHNSVRLITIWYIIHCILFLRLTYQTHLKSTNARPCPNPSTIERY